MLVCIYLLLSWVTEQIIGHLLIISLPHLLLQPGFFFFFLNDAKACMCMRAYIYSSLLCVCGCDTARACWWGFKGRAGRAGLAVFVPAGINASRKPGSKVRLRSSKPLLPLSFLCLFPPLLSLFLHLLAFASVTAASRSAQGCCCLLAWYGPLLL